ncbi:HypC/HybG/HupF family hydrogenase formation chaperone [Rosettibacter firmus]|uniref:HypC/HybG/HupF family hydrogenase formation chaperone n=1 Tax=Rosettibacter firmus TaxID=3111522 RepID=UPI00336BE753
MCLAIPGRVISISNTDTESKIAKVDFGGVIREVCVDWIPDIKIGDYVLVHVGFALNKLDEKEAEEILNTIKNLEEN